MPDDNQVRMLLGRITVEQAWTFGTAAVKMIMGAAPVFAVLWAITWGYWIRPAIAQVTQEEVGQRVNQLEAALADQQLTLEQQNIILEELQREQSNGRDESTSQLQRVIQLLCSDPSRPNC